MVQRSRLAASIAAVLLAGCPTPPAVRAPARVEPPPAELVLRGGVIETLDPETQGSTAIAIAGGRVLRVGRDEQMAQLIGPRTRVVALDGQTVVPGLADAHVHLVGLGLRRLGLDLVGTRSIEDVRARLKEAVNQTPKGEWIRGRGWDQNDWESFRKKGLKFPTARDLDAVSPDHPVVLTRIDGHAIWVNSRGLAAAGIDAKSKSKPGGEIIKVGGKPSGVFIDNAIALITDKLPPLTPQQLSAALRLAETECLAAGLTQVHEMGVDASTLAALRSMDDQGALKLRVYAMLDGSADGLEARLGSGPPEPRSERARLSLRGVKFYVDGALGSRGAALLQPYADDKKTSGMIVTPPDVLEERFKLALAHGYQVATHAIGDRGNRIVLDLYEKVLGPQAIKARWRIEHAQVLSPQDIPRFAPHGVIASIQPKQATSDMPWAPRRLGKGRLAGAYAWKSLLTSGATVAAGSDAPIEEIPPILGIYAAVTRRDELGVPAQGWLPEQRLTPKEALTIFTYGPAYASFRENEAGKLRPGFVGDLTVLDRNPLSASPEDLALIRVTMTVVGGEVAFERPNPTSSTSTSTSTKAGR